MKKIAQVHKPDIFLLITVVLLTLFGLLMVYNASPVTSLRDFSDPLYLFKQQAIWIAAGIALAAVAYKIPYSLLKSLSLPLIVFSLVLLLSIFIPGFGVTIYGAQRWLKIGFVGIQPAEFAKLAYIVFLSAVFSKKPNLGVFLAITAVLLGIVLLQKDLGTAIVLAAIGVSLYFVSSAPLWHLLVLLPIGALSGAVLILTSAYRRARFLAFLNPNVDTQGISYHLHQALIAIGSGGVFGVGLGQSRQKYGFIPEVTTDSIFSVIGNELGFIGSVVFICAFLVIVYRGFKIASASNDRFAYFVAIGISTWIGVQTLLNLSGLIALLPLTGVPLPFVSYGGSSLLAVLLASGILLNISRHTHTASKSFKEKVKQ